MSFICQACGYDGIRRTLTPGSRGMEIFLWTVLLIPGPPYSIWRIMARQHFCPNCKSEGTMCRTWLPKGRLVAYENETKLLKEIAQMEDRLREEGKLKTTHDQTF